MLGEQVKADRAAIVLHVERVAFQPQHIDQPGHMGAEMRTVQNLRVVKIIADKNLILVKGAIPGANGDDVIIRSGKKAKPAKKA